MIAVVQFLILLGIANGAPILARRIFGQRFTRPVDGGIGYPDGRPLFGRSKTWLGVVAAVVATAAAAPLFGKSIVTGALIGLLAMTGDLLSSFFKRRMGIESSRRSLALDLIPEAALPVLALGMHFGLDGLDMLAVIVLFMVGDLVISPLLVRLGIRGRSF